MLCHSFGGTILHDVWFPNSATAHRRKRFAQWIVLTENAGMIQMLVDPVLEEFELPKINHKSVFIRFAAPESYRDTPIVPMQIGAMAIVPVLPMSPRNINIGFSAGKHTHAESFQPAWTRSRVDGALLS